MMSAADREHLRSMIIKLHPYSNRWAVRVKTMSDVLLLAVYTEHYPNPFRKEESV